MEPFQEIHPGCGHSPLRALPTPLRSLPVYHADVLVVGSGVAGLSAALSAAEAGCHVQVLSKDRLRDTNTRQAQGGIAAAVGLDDSSEFHGGDTLQVGCGLSDFEVVRTFVERGPDAISWLQKLGMRFDLQVDGKLSLGQEGGHKMPRILHSDGTATGMELQRVLMIAARLHPKIDLCEHTAAIELLKDPDDAVCGLVALKGEEPNVQAVIFEADSVVLASGGGGQLFRETTNPSQATADGLALGLRAGADLQDLEFVQFHPTILYLAGAARFLISEVTRGAGALLRDRNGAAFMAEEHPDAELAPRDVVSRSIFRRMIETEDTHVSLDFSTVNDPEGQFPHLARITREFGIRLAQDPVPVRPAVHYFVGGLATDILGRTSLSGLWACGECASTGFHGANRMGSNSLLEGLVHGRIVGQAVSKAEHRPRRRFLQSEHAVQPTPPDVELSLSDMTYSLKSLLWRQVGIERDGAGLSDALARIERWESYLERLGPMNRAGVETLNMVQVARALALSSLFRQESRGAHYREDFPNLDPRWQQHSRIKLGPDGFWLRTVPTRSSSKRTEV